MRGRRIGWGRRGKVEKERGGRGAVERGRERNGVGRAKRVVEKEKLRKKGNWRK